MQKAHFPVWGCKLPGFKQRRIGPNTEIWGNSGLPFPTVPCLHQGNNYIKRKRENGELKNVIFVSVQKAHSPMRGGKLPGFMQLWVGPNMEIWGNSGLPFPTALCTNAIIISKGRWGNGEPKNVILMSLQKAHFPLWGWKPPGFMQRRIGPNLEIWGNLRLPFPTVPCLHQGNNYIKRKLREWRA